MPSYRVEFAKKGAAVCKDTECKKNQVKIEKDTLRLGTFTETEQFSSWSWKHWGCVSGAQLQGLRDTCESKSSYDWDLLDGYDELASEIQEKVRRCIEQGHIDPQDFRGDPECNVLGHRGIRLTKSGRKKAEVPDNKSDDDQAMKKQIKPGHKKIKTDVDANAKEDRLKSDLMIKLTEALKTKTTESVVKKRVVADDEADDSATEPATKKTKHKKAAKQKRGDGDANSPDGQHYGDEHDENHRVVSTPDPAQAALKAKSSRKRKSATGDDQGIHATDDPEPEPATSASNLKPSRKSKSARVDKHAEVPDVGKLGTEPELVHSAPKSKSGRKKKNTAVDDDDDEQIVPKAESAKSASSKSKSSRKTKNTADDDEHEQIAPEPEPAKSASSKSKSSRKTKNSAVDEDDDDEQIAPKPEPAKPASSKSKSSRKTKNSAVEEDDDYEKITLEPEPTTSKAKSSRKTKNTALEEDDDYEKISLEPEPTIPKSKSSRKTKSSAVDDNDEQISLEAEPATSASKSMPSRKKKPVRADDDDDLGNANGDAPAPEPATSAKAGKKKTGKGVGEDDKSSTLKKRGRTAAEAE